MHKRGYRIPSYQFAVFLYILQESFAKGGLAVSHLFFANDLVLFGKADTKNCLSMMMPLRDSMVFLGKRLIRKNLGSIFPPM